MEFRKFKKKGKWYVCPMTEPDYTIEDYKTGVEVFDWRMNSPDKYFQRSKNRSVNLDSTIIFHDI